MIRDYYWYYIAYDELKKALRTEFVSAPTQGNTKPNRKAWTEDDEKHFVTLLESELDKVRLTLAAKGVEAVVSEFLDRSTRLSDILTADPVPAPELDRPLVSRELRKLLLAGGADAASPPASLPSPDPNPATST